MNELIQQQALAVKDNLSLQEAYQTVMKANSEFLGGFHTVLNILCILFILLNFLRSVQQQPFIFSGSTQSALSPMFLITHVGLIFAILFYRQIFSFCEGVLVNLSDGIVLSSGKAQEIWSECLEEFFVQASWDTASKLTEYNTALDPALTDIETMGNDNGITLPPNSWAYAFCAISTIISFFSYLMSFVAYVDRSLVLLLLNTLAPIVFALSILPDYRRLTANFFTLLLAVMLAYPFTLIGFNIVDIIYIRFCTILEITGNLSSISEVTAIISSRGSTGLNSMVEQLNYRIFVKLPLLLFVLCLKLKYLKLIIETIWRMLKA